MGLESDGHATYNPSTGVITATGFSGATVVASTSVDVTGSAGLILQNDETITNAINGTVLINGTVAGGTGSAAGVFQSSGNHDVTLKTGNENTGTITITDGTDGDIAITPNGAGKVQLDGIAWPTADGSANQIMKTDGSGALSWTDVSSTTVNITDNESTDESNAIVFTSDGDVDGGTMGLESDGNATYNPSTGVITATGFSGATVVASTSVDVTGSAGLILENDETITNSTDGTVLINGTVAGGTGSAVGVFQSNGDYDVTLQTGNSTTGSITITDGANGDITLAPNGSGKTDFNDNAITGYGADLQTESGTSKTLAASDNGTIIVCSSSSAVTITVPASLPSGFNCMIIQSGSGQVSLSASSTTLNNRNGSKTAGQYAILTLVHLGSNVFVVSGDTTS
jgi:hypothetical protein